MKNIILSSFLILVCNLKINSQKLYIDSYSKTTYYINRNEDSSINIKNLSLRLPNDIDHMFRQHIFDLDNMTSTYYCGEDSSIIDIKIDFISNTKMIIHILEDGDDYGYVIDIDPNNQMFYRYDMQLDKFIELNTFEYIIHASM